MSKYQSIVGVVAGFIFFSALVVGCGGGSSPSPSASTTPTPSPAPTAPPVGRGLAISMQPTSLTFDPKSGYVGSVNSTEPGQTRLVHINGTGFVRPDVPYTCYIESLDGTKKSNTSKVEVNSATFATVSELFVPKSFQPQPGEADRTVHVVLLDTGVKVPEQAGGMTIVLHAVAPQ